MPDQTGGAAQGIALGPIGSAGVAAGMGLVNNVSNLIFGRALQKQQLKGYKESLQASNAAAMDMWNRTNYSAQVAHMKEAGLNPGLMYGMSGGGGATTGNAGAMPQSGGGMGVMSAGEAAQIRLLEAQAKNLDADTAQKTATEGNLNQDTKNKVLEGIIKDYAGKTAQADFEDFIGGVGTDEDQIYREQRIARQEKFYQETGANIAAAKQLVKLYEDGTMQKMTEAELQQKLSDIGLKNVEITGKEIENALNKLELGLMEKLNLGKGAKGWIDTGANLIMNLIKLAVMKKGK